MTVLLGAAIAAAALWGWAGVIFHVSYGPTVLPTIAQAYGTPNECRILVNEGFAYYEQGAPDDYLLKVMVHEYGHCLWLDHSSDCGSIMWPVINECDGAVITTQDRLNVKSMRDIVLTNRIFVAGLSHAE